MGFGNLRHVVAESEFDIRALLQAELEQFGCARLQPWTRHRLPEGIHLRRKLLGRRQGNVVHEAPDVRQTLPIEGGDPAREAVHEVVGLVVRNCAVDVPVPLGSAW